MSRYTNLDPIMHILDKLEHDDQIQLIEFFTSKEEYDTDNRNMFLKMNTDDDIFKDYTYPSMNTSKKEE